MTCPYQFTAPSQTLEIGIQPPYWHWNTPTFLTTLALERIKNEHLNLMNQFVISFFSKGAHGVAKE